MPTKREPVTGAEQFAIYVVDIDGKRTRLATTDLVGVGVTLVTLRREGQTTNDDRVGILDRGTRTWIVNPWARGGSPRVQRPTKEER